ncbi:MAG: glutathione S-transferase family protein [Alphaproteobacteria bacterium]
MTTPDPAAGQGFTLFGDRRSGNCLKVSAVADHLGLAYRWHEVDILAGESRTAAFLALNPMGQVPAVRFADGRTLAQSNAIIRHLARGSDLLPDDPYAQAQVDEWLFWEQYSHEPYIAVCRFHMLYQGRPADAREPWRVERGEAALDLMERRLAERPWLVGDGATVADAALLAYTRLAHEGGFDLAGRPAVRAWIDRAQAALGLTAVA